jgi:uncharacterized protein YciW
VRLLPERAYLHRGKVGLTEKDIADARHARAAAQKIDAILKLARSLVVQRGEVNDADLEQARASGLTDGDIVETVANVALNRSLNMLQPVSVAICGLSRVKCR